MPSGCFLERTRFNEYLIGYNGLTECGFRNWAFYPGMLFNSTAKWWEMGGKRDNPHEGLDLCLYRDEDGGKYSLGATAKVPVIYEGGVVRIIDDFIGKSVFVSHSICDGKGNQLHTIYGHVEPCDGIIRGKMLNEGDIIATITDARREKAKMSSHVHISVAWIPKASYYKNLNWELLNDSSIVTLLDPLKVISCKYTILSYPLQL